MAKLCHDAIFILGQSRLGVVAVRIPGVRIELHTFFFAATALRGVEPGVRWSLHHNTCGIVFCRDACVSGPFYVSIIIFLSALITTILACGRAACLCFCEGLCNLFYIVFP